MRFVTEILKLPIHVYRLLISPLLGPRCRFHPSCSSYALEAFDTHGPVRGLILSLYRIVRCGPWSSGGIDPVPARKERG